MQLKRFVLCSMLLIVWLANTSFNYFFKYHTGYSVFITKSKYELTVYDNDGNWVATYPVVFGNKDLGDKMYEGDRRTPEGEFQIISKRPHPKWCDFLQINYPRQEDVQKFNFRKQSGLIPKTARIGGSIGIHGTWPNEDFAVDEFQNWTMGCISTKNEYIKELYDLLPVGTKVTIVR